ncbi:cation channel sperm-associated auxiliary subunit delta [Castor canadensis]|uniref:Cation channel sperm-associated auxiliary subunit delta n=1 Tax=Castor canadensis TaxID=51338 RepID=A0AC58L048_CASCN
MLVWMLVATAAVWLWPLARAQPLCGTRTIRTGKVLDSTQHHYGDDLYFSSNTTFLIKHPCRKHIALYLGADIFFTRDNFESSLTPFSIPESMEVGNPVVTSAHFSDRILLLVVNQKVYIYDYLDNIWDEAEGIQHPVSHVTGDNCCYSLNKLCTEMHNTVFAYMHGEDLSQTHIYFSDNGGYSFDSYSPGNQLELPGTLGGIFFFHSLSQSGMLAVLGDIGMFFYTEHPLKHRMGLSFQYDSPLEVIIVPGQRGFLIFWNEKHLFMSPNSGQLVDTVRLTKGENVLFSSITDASVTIHTIATNENELAVLTREDHLYYGSLGFLSTSVIKLPHQPVWSPEVALMFHDSGRLEILTPVFDGSSLAFDFEKCSVNIQAVLMEPELQVPKCKVELLQGQFEEDMYTIDMNSLLILSASFIPRPGTSPIPLVMVSNPYSLGLHAFIEELGNTLDGNTKYSLNVQLQQQQHSGRTHPNFTSSIKRPTVSTLIMDIANKEISCVDLKPLSMLISVGCDLTKKIVVQNKISACTKGILDPVDLQRNYTYIIEKEAYDPNFLGHKATNDLFVVYPYKDLGCPRLVYFNTPWKPVLELWQEEEMKEIVDAEYVLVEVNGLFTYSYSLTADSAHCRSQPQNWSSMKQEKPSFTFTTWNRENYISCHEHNKDMPLRWPNAEYQVLGGKTDNEIIFDQRNGIYIFYLSIVDPYYR